MIRMLSISTLTFALAMAATAASAKTMDLTPTAVGYQTTVDIAGKDARTIRKELQMAAYAVCSEALRDDTHSLDALESCVAASLNDTFSTMKESAPTTYAKLTPPTLGK